MPRPRHPNCETQNGNFTLDTHFLQAYGFYEAERPHAAASILY